MKDGIVSLRGEASSQAQRELTTEYAKDVEGVKEVKNEMTIAKTPATQTVVSGGTASFTLTGTNTGPGGTGDASVRVTVLPVPTVTLSAAPPGEAATAARSDR